MTRKKNLSREEMIRLIEGQYHFYGYEKSIYDYDKFDSYTEYQFAEYINKVLLTGPGDPQIKFGVDNSSQKKMTVSDATRSYGVKNETFWIKNQRNVHFTYGARKYYPDFIVFKDGIIYVIETKGEIFSDTKKNQLLKKLDEVPGDGAIKGYKGLLVFSTQMDEIIDDDADFDEFVKLASDTVETQRFLAGLVPDPPEEERFIKYIPAYTEEKAYKKFIKKGKTAKPMGWLEVTVVQDGYPKTSFAVQVRGNALAPLYEDKQWIILNHVMDIDKVSGIVALLKLKDVSHGYKYGFTIRVIDVSEEKKRGEMFPVKNIFIHQIKDKNDFISLDYGKSDGVIIIGIAMPS